MGFLVLKKFSDFLLAFRSEGKVKVKLLKLDTGGRKNSVTMFERAQISNQEKFLHQILRPKSVQRGEWKNTNYETFPLRQNVRVRCMEGWTT